MAGWWQDLSPACARKRAREGVLVGDVYDNQTRSMIQTDTNKAALSSSESRPILTAQSTCTSDHKRREVARQTGSRHHREKGGLPTSAGTARLRIRLDCVPEQSVTVHTAESSAEVENTCTTGFLSKLLHCPP
jgi:hypothetical protein